MRTLSSTAALLALLATMSCGGSPAIDRGALSCEEQGPVTIELVASGFEHAEGEVRVALYGDGNGFPGEPESALQRGMTVVDQETARFVFDPVPCGRYAVSVFHDEDGDGEMKTDWLGRPQEGWGVSNDARGSMGPPSFEDAAFDADSDRLVVELRMKY